MEHREEHIRQPFPRKPGRPGTAERKKVDMRNLSVRQNPLARAHMPARVAVAEKRSRTIQLEKNEDQRHQESEVGQGRKEARDSWRLFDNRDLFGSDNCRGRFHGRGGKKHQITRSAATGIEARSLVVTPCLPFIKRMLRIRSAISCEFPSPRVTRSTSVRHRITLGPNSEFSGN